MLAMTAMSLRWPDRDKTRKPAPPKADWPLMCDVATLRAGVPEALIHWRKAEGKSPPQPADR